MQRVNTSNKFHASITKPRGIVIEEKIISIPLIEIPNKDSAPNIIKHKDIMNENKIKEIIVKRLLITEITIKTRRFKKRMPIKNKIFGKTFSLK